MLTNPPRPIALNELLRQASALQPELSAVANRVLASEWHILGRECAAFESEFAAYCGVPHCVSVADGTGALELALPRMEVGPCNAVAAVANAGGCSMIAIGAVGDEMLCIDVDPDSINVPAAEFAARATPSVRAVIAGAIAVTLALSTSILVIVAKLLGDIPDVPIVLATLSFCVLSGLRFGIVDQYLWLGSQIGRRRPNFIVHSAEEHGAKDL
jgi:hypothetical protein